MPIHISKVWASRWLRAGCAASVALLASCSDSGTGPGSGTQPTISAAAALAVGNQFTCVLTTAGAAWCWGRDTSGTLGDGGTSNSNVPVAVGGVPPLIQISATWNSICGLTASGQVWCWGELPARPVATSHVPTLQPSAPTRLVSIAVGQDYVCGLDAAGAAYCWGQNNRYELGLGDTVSRTAPTRVAPGTTFTSISASIITTCGLARGGVGMCWGSNQEGGLGTQLPESTNEPNPAIVTGGQVFASVSAGGVDTCGLIADGTAYCWGTNQFGELGMTPEVPEFVVSPVAVTTNIHYTSMVPARENDRFTYTCAIALDATGYCWGYNVHNQAGAFTGSLCATTPGGTKNQACAVAPTAVAGLAPVAAIGPGDDHTCAITTAKQVVCWGSNSHGQLGDGTFTSRATPAPIQGTFAVP